MPCAAFLTSRITVFGYPAPNDKGDVTQGERGAHHHWPAGLGSSRLAGRAGLKTAGILRPPIRMRTLQKLDASLDSVEQLGPSLSEPSSPRN